MTQDSTEKLSKDEFIRGKLYGGKESGWRRYSKLVIGEASVWRLFKYEVITGLFGSLPGAIGLALRKVTYPSLFKRVGSGVVFGRHVVIRNAGNIQIGDGVIIDDQSLIDAHGLTGEGITIGDRVIVNRGAVIIAKSAGINIGADSDIGSRASVISTGGIEIGERVAIAGDCKIGGSVAEMEGDNAESDSDAVGGALQKFSKGLITIGNNAILYMSATVLDGVSVGSGSTVGSGIILHDSIPDDSVVVAHQKLIYFDKNGQSRGSTLAKAAEASGTRDIRESDPVEVDTASSNMAGNDSVTNAIYSAIDELNFLRAESNKLAKSLDTELQDLDSMDKVNLIVETEQQLAETLARPVNLDGQVLMSDSAVVFQTIESYASAVSKLIQNS